MTEMWIMCVTRLMVFSVFSGLRLLILNVMHHNGMNYIEIDFFNKQSN